MGLCGCCEGGCLIGFSSESGEEAIEARIFIVAMGGFSACCYKKFKKSDE